MCLRWTLFCCDSIVELVGKCEEVRLGLIRSEETPRTGIWQLPLRLLKIVNYSVRTTAHREFYWYMEQKELGKAR